jgi:ferredoxin
MKQKMTKAILLTLTLPGNGVWPTFEAVLNPLKSTGYGMQQQVEYFNNCTLCPHCIYMFCISLRTNSDLCHLQHKLIGFYNRDEKCLQRGTDWVFK